MGPGETECAARIANLQGEMEAREPGEAFHSLGFVPFIILLVTLISVVQSPIRIGFCLFVSFFRGLTIFAV